MSKLKNSIHNTLLARVLPSYKGKKVGIISFDALSHCSWTRTRTRVPRHPEDAHVNQIIVVLKTCEQKCAKHETARTPYVLQRQERRPRGKPLEPHRAGHEQRRRWGHLSATHRAPRRGGGCAHSCQGHHGRAL